VHDDGELVGSSGCRAFEADLLAQLHGPGAKIASGAAAGQDHRQAVWL
jgi:hypothetical protein